MSKQYTIYTWFPFIYHYCCTLLFYTTIFLGGGADKEKLLIGNEERTNEKDQFFYTMKTVFLKFKMRKQRCFVFGQLLLYILYYYVCIV